MNLFSNLMDDVVTGNVVLEDQLNFLSNLPIIGNEVLSINILSSDNEVLSKKFRVNEVLYVHQVNAELTRYTLQLVSDEFFVSNQTPIKQSFSRMTISDMVESSFSFLKSSKKIDIESTDGVYDFIIPNWSVFKTINWFAEKAISSDRKGANYLFYEDFDGFKFKSLETLFEQDIYRKYFQGNRGILDEEEEQDEIVRNIYDFTVEKTFNVLQNQNSGMYSSSLLTHSLLDRKIKSYDFNYKESFAEYSHLEKNKLLPDEVDGIDYSNSSSNKYFLPANSQFKPERYFQIRKSQMQQLNGITIEIVVSGDFKINIGSIVSLDIMSPQLRTSRIKSDDRYFSGKYIVSAVKHILNKAHHTVLVLRKDSLYRGVE